ncbi:cysteine desulfurase family protein [Caproiciproducens faecalis]|uniref:Cysteine desulfurase n=1 Tax=Caproiciproducens faecalis TaxID=2820301 RepID=A0ABS7DNB7_9FIRM|nr:cysteine desulfurase family protein [Caproiciproducens faecalis]MBW7572300.1 cysteine desulfurase [Caproiciproducens faecalis]
MIYLDYAANTPVCEEALQTFCAVSRDYIANPNSPHPLGLAAKERLDAATEQIADILHVKPEEIIYTSGASESNNLAIKGAAGQYQKYGKHIITTWLEHSSVNGAMAALQERGFEIEYVDIQENGLVDLEHLKELMRDDTILVSVCYVDSEIGIRQQIGRIAELLAEYPHCLFHVDATQAVGKIPLEISGADLVTFAPHKFYGLNGCGVLIKKENVLLEPQIHGGTSTTPFRSGTPALGLIASTAQALESAEKNREERCEIVSAMNRILRDALKKYPKVRINSTAESVPYILNISIAGAKAEQFQSELAGRGICLSTKSACCAANTPSRPVYALTKDRRAALSTLRISLSHLTTQEEIGIFLKAFDECYRQFVK